jgi:hypothetical protein
VLHPPQNRGVCQADTTLAHHHDQIAIAQLETQIPTHAQHDDLSVKVPTAEELLNWYERWHLLMIANLAGVCTRANPSCPRTLKRLME